MIKLVGFLRGINVGGHHKVPMAELKSKLAEIGCKNVTTLLNSGNFVFETTESNIKDLELKIESYISNSFGFSIPVILITHNEINDLVSRNPFSHIDSHKDIRLYVTFLKDIQKSDINIPYTSADNSFQIIAIHNKIILSVLDLSKSKTTKGMEDLDKIFGKNITTRNWNTIMKLNTK